MQKKKKKKKKKKKEGRTLPAVAPSLERPSTAGIVQPLVLSYVAIEPKRPKRRT
jgi:hypothetical protein